MISLARLRAITGAPTGDAEDAYLAELRRQAVAQVSQLGNIPASAGERVDLLTAAGETVPLQLGSYPHVVDTLRLKYPVTGDLVRVETREELTEAWTEAADLTVFEVVTLKRRIRRTDGERWPIGADLVRVTYETGWAEDQAPASVDRLISQLVTSWYRPPAARQSGAVASAGVRGASVTFRNIGEVPPDIRRDIEALNYQDFG